MAHPLQFPIFLLSSADQAPLDSPIEGEVVCGLPAHGRAFDDADLHQEFHEASLGGLDALFTIPL